MSLSTRAVVAIVLVVAFYAVALSTSAGLAWLSIRLFGFLAEVRIGYGMVVLGAIAAACAVSAIVVVWSVLPRFDRFEPPGPEIEEADHPRLFAELRSIAAAAGQRMPAHVYLVHQVNAFVAARGGIMGIGSRRVMGLGLPLLRALQIDELRAVIAHELGHFHGGDTTLGPWIYKTRSALARTVLNLARVRASIDHWIHHVFGAIMAPFRLFFVGFMRVSQAISRAQEYGADALSVRIAGQRAVVAGLKKTIAANVAYAQYMRWKVMPLLERGALPPIGDGFSQLVATAQFAQLIESVVELELKHGTSDPYDSHPALRDRLAAVASLEGAYRRVDPRRAIDLLDNADAIETELISSLVEHKLAPVSWASTGALWVVIWREEVRRAMAALKSIPVLAPRLSLAEMRGRISRLVHGETALDVDANQARDWWMHTAGAALAVNLVDAGFSPEIRGAEPARFVRGDDAIEPFMELTKLLMGEISEEDWRARWKALGFSGRTLA